MDISWLGFSCIRLRTRQAIVLLDPFAKADGMDMSRPNADIVTVSYDDERHGHIAGVRGTPLVIPGPGEYEVQGVQITGIPTTLKGAAEGDKKKQANTSYVIEAEGLRVAQLGAIGKPPTAEESEPLANADILVLPIGEDGLSPDDAARTVRALEPTITIPVGYNGGADDPTLKAFITAVGLQPEAAVPRLTVQARAGTEAQRIVLLEPRG